MLISAKDLKEAKKIHEEVYPEQGGLAPDESRYLEIDKEGLNEYYDEDYNQSKEV